MVPVQKVLLTVKQKANQQASSRSDRIMTFEYSESNRISGFTLSVSVPPAARPTYSFVLDWEKQKEPKISSSNDKEKKHNVKQFSLERTIKDSNSLSSTENSLSLSKLLAAKESEKIGGDWKSQTDRVRHFTHSEFEKKTDVEEKQHANAKNQPYDNLESYERSIDNDSKRNKDLNNMNRSEEYRNFMIELTVIIRNFKNDNETTENVITDKIISSSTLINALKSILRNAPISSMHVSTNYFACLSLMLHNGSDYGRLFLFPDGKRTNQVRELPYDQNRYKLLTELCNSGKGCTLLLDLTNTFLKQAT